MAPAPASDKSLQCAYCAKAFGRVEHLKRHELIHTKKQQFNCPVCAKEFTRRDALQRHELTHQASSPSLLSKGARACTACAAAKVRCSGEPHCLRCQQRVLRCSYPDSSGSNVGQTLDQAMDMAPEANPSVEPSQAQQADGQHQLFSPMAPQMPIEYGAVPMDPDFWNPNILSASNWLDGVVEIDFPYASPQFGFYNHDTPAFQPGQQVWNPQVSTQVLQGSSAHANSISPAALASTPSGQSGRSAAESAADVCAAQNEAESRKGEYYVDGEPARLPRTKRRKLSSRLVSRPALNESVSTFSLQSSVTDSADLKHRISIPSNTYDQLLKAWQSVCLSNLGPWVPFDTSEFVPNELFEHLLGRYFASFQPTLPFMHPATFDPEKTDWILILAMTAIGARYLQDHSDTLADSLQEFLRRSLFYQKEIVDWAPMDSLSLAQCRLLAFVGMMYSGDRRLVACGRDMQPVLASSFADIISTCAEVETSNTNDHDSDWAVWTQMERNRRTAYSILLVDSIVAYQFQRRPFISPSDCDHQLPCREKLWALATAIEWKTQSATHTTEPSLQQAVQELYIDKRVPPDRGEFARIIMLHGLFHRSWEVARYYSNPLSKWEPTATKQSSTDILPNAPIWPPSVTTYTKWQSSACDCLDVLHWQANATIGQASGLEHSTVCFLHLSRIVLLSPIDSIVRLAKALASRSDLSATAADKQFIQRWALQGQYKARLAAIHAGTVFWHIRRYSVDGFYESPAVALAALLLWAFGTFSVTQPNGPPSKPTRPNGEASDNVEKSKDVTDEDSEGSACGIILLDRPTDDELVQQFIRKGHTMRANLSGVGDLYGPKGPERVLLEGCKLLASLKCWGVSTVWLEVLEGLAQSCKK